MANFVISAYSYAIAWSGFSFAARRAGMIAARIPMMIATIVSTISCVHGIEKRTSNSLKARLTSAARKPRRSGP